MRKGFSVLAVIAAMTAAPLPAGAETWYAGAFGGANYTHDGSVNAAGTNAEYDFGLGIGGYVGFFVQPNVRLEAELSYRANDIDTIGGVGNGGEVQTTALMANVLFDFELKSEIEPYLGAGLGVADIDYSIVDDKVLALQLIAGAGIRIAPTAQLTVDYRLFLTENLEAGGAIGFGDIEYVNSAVMVGIRKTF